MTDGEEIGMGPKGLRRRELMVAGAGAGLALFEACVAAVPYAPAAAFLGQATILVLGFTRPQWVEWRTAGPMATPADAA